MPSRVVTAAVVFLTVMVLGLTAFQIGGILPAPGVTNATRDLPPPSEPVAMVSYLTTARSLPPGTLVRPEDFAVRSVSPSQLPPEAVVDMPSTRTDLRGSLVRRFLEAGTPLRAADLTRPREKGFLQAVLSPGTRAVSVGVDPVSGVAGLIWPGDRVDVLLTQEFPPAAPGSRGVVTSETILTDARIVAVDQDITQGAPANGSAGRLASTITLEVGKDQAERLAVSARLGHLSLAARSAADPDQPILISPGGVSGADVSEVLSRVRATAMGGTAPQGTASQGTASQGTASQGMTPNGTATGGTMPAMTMPGVTTPAVTTPGVTPPAMTTPGTATGSAPAAATPAGRTAAARVRVIEGGHRSEVEFK